MAKESPADVVQLGRVCVPILPSLLSPLIINGIRKGWYERDERQAIEAAVRPGDRVLELGGGLGVCSAAAALTTRLASLTIVEANPNLLEAIRLTMSLNGITEFELMWGAVSAASATTTRLQVGEHYWAAREAAGSGSDTIEVPVLSAHSILERLKPQIMICDIEGNEEHLIETANLSEVRSFIVEFHPGCYGQTIMYGLDAKLCASGFTRLTEWTGSERPQVHRYERVEELPA